LGVLLAAAVLVFAAVRERIWQVAVSDPRRPLLCAVDPQPPRLVRYASDRFESPGGPSFGLVLEDREGVPARVFNLTAWGNLSADSSGEARDREEGLYGQAFELARERWSAYLGATRSGQLGLDPSWETFSEEIVPDQVCAPIAASRAELVAGERLIIGTAFNYIEHAAEAGGRDVFFFPKPVLPTGPYDSLVLGAETTLLDYEVELGLVLLHDIDLAALPSALELDERVAYFVANDVSDREAMLRAQPFFGGPRVTAAGKVQPGFLPSGPWLVHGRDLHPFSAACTRFFELALEVEADGVRTLRQLSHTGRMRKTPRELLLSLVAALGVNSAQTAEGGGALSAEAEALTRQLGLASGRPLLPRGSILLTGTPAGTAFRSPQRVRTLVRALLHLRAPREQWLDDLQQSRRAQGYLAAGDRVYASIQWLGSQNWPVVARREKQTSAAKHCEISSPVF